MIKAFIYGSPATVAKIIVAQYHETGAGSLPAYHAECLEADERAHHCALWERVLPMLESANI